jgi:hypothetical protein
MTAFWVALAVGSVIALVYVTLAIGTFIRVRRAVLHGDPIERGGADDVVVEEGGFTWKAIGAGIASLGVIVLISLDGAFWYLPPLLALGSAVAVICAFLTDRH